MEVSENIHLPFHPGNKIKPHHVDLRTFPPTCRASPSSEKLKQLTARRQQPLDIIANLRQPNFLFNPPSYTRKTLPPLHPTGANFGKTIACIMTRGPPYRQTLSPSLSHSNIIYYPRVIPGTPRSFLPSFPPRIKPLRASLTAKSTRQRTYERPSPPLHTRTHREGKAVPGVL